MPFIRITHHGEALKPAVIARLQSETTRQMVEILRKEGRLTAVLVEQAQGGWSVGGAPVARGVHSEAIITKGTNTPDDKAAYLAAQKALMAALFPDLAEATYCVIREVEGADWGYDGLSQAERRRRREAL